MDSAIDIPGLTGMGFPIRRSPAQCLFSGSPKLIAANHVLHRHPAPRHPPSALSSLAINFFSFTPATSSSKTLSVPFFLYSVFKERAEIFDFGFMFFSSGVGSPTPDDKNIGGGERDRTDDLLRAKQVLSQLSYTPKFVVGLVGIEPTTSRLSGVRSNRD